MSCDKWKRLYNLPHANNLQIQNEMNQTNSNNSSSEEDSGRTRRRKAVAKSGRKRKKVFATVQTSGSQCQNKKGKPHLQFKPIPVPLEDQDALSVARELGYEDPFMQIVLKYVHGPEDKDEESASKRNKCHTSTPVEIIQQVIDYKKRRECPCFENLRLRDLASHRLEVTLLEKQFRDFFIMGLLRSAAVTTATRRGKVDSERSRYKYHLMNTTICQNCFMFVNNIGQRYLRNLRKHVNKHGLCTRVHGNIGKQPRNTVQPSEISYLVAFIERYAKENGVISPRNSRNPSAKRIIRLPAADKFSTVYKKYKQECDAVGERKIGITTFRKIWLSKADHIKLTWKEVAAASKVKNHIAPKETMTESNISPVLTGEIPDKSSRTPQEKNTSQIPVTDSSSQTDQANISHNLTNHAKYELTSREVNAQTHLTPEAVYMSDESVAAFAADTYHLLLPSVLKNDPVYQMSVPASSSVSSSCDLAQNRYYSPKQPTLPTNPTQHPLSSLGGNSLPVFIPLEQSADSVDRKMVMMNPDCTELQSMALHNSGVISHIIPSTTISSSLENHQQHRQEEQEMQNNMHASNIGSAVQQINMALYQ